MAPNVLEKLKNAFGDPGFFIRRQFVHNPVKKQAPPADKHVEKPEKPSRDFEKMTSKNVEKCTNFYGNKQEPLFEHIFSFRSPKRTYV